MTRIAGIVLAGGESRRMGQPKSLLTFAGRTFIENVIAMLSEAGADPIIAVLGPDPDAVRGIAERAGARVVVNPDFSEGQFSSLRCGVRALSSDDPERPLVDAALVALVDQPHVPVVVPRSLASEFAQSGAPIVRPVWAGSGGHPLLFSSETFQFILSLPVGATPYAVVQNFLDRRRDVPAPDNSVLTDIDTPGDLEKLRTKYS